MDSDHAVELKTYYKISASGATRAVTNQKGVRSWRAGTIPMSPKTPARRGEFKEINEAYEVLAHPRTERNTMRSGRRLATRRGFEPPPGWQSHTWRGTGGGSASIRISIRRTGFSDFFEQFFGGCRVLATSPAPGGAAPDEQGFKPSPHARSDIEVTCSSRWTKRFVLIRSVSVRGRIRAPGPHGNADLQGPHSCGSPGWPANSAGRQGGSQLSGGGLATCICACVSLLTRTFGSGADLYQESELTPWERCWAQRSKSTRWTGACPSGSPGNTTGAAAPGARPRLPVGNTGQRGHLYVTVAVKVPVQLTAEERALWEQLARKSELAPAERVVSRSSRGG